MNSPFATTLRTAAFWRSVRYDQTTPETRAEQDAAEVRRRQRGAEWYDGLMERARLKNTNKPKHFSTNEPS